MSSGYVKLYRQIWEWDSWFEEPFTRGQAWIDILMLANHRPGSFRVRGNLIRIERGQLGRSIVGLADRWQWSRQKVTSFLDDLEGEQQIKQQKSNKTTIVTVNNYEKYQGDFTAELTPEKPQKSTNNKNKNGKKEYTPDFLTFWDAYPRKSAKADAFKAWCDRKDFPLKEILKSLEVFKRSDDWMKDGGNYIPYPATWIRKRRWEDELEVKSVNPDLPSQELY